ncbi:hypothetical protein BGW80DRAFT_28808 [Lactifluus volemus]|nr:hypothetical protein BGW80DRAFT_28808 [Lactifluus volemus]
MSVRPGTCQEWENGMGSTPRSEPNTLCLCKLKHYHVAGIVQVITISSSPARRRFPHVIGVYTRPGQIDIAMDLPHPVLWMEASASMPMVLKDRVVEAFQRLHERGVVHGDVALRHILIGPDARVTLIDFQASRADQPNEDLGWQRRIPVTRIWRCVVSGFCLIWTTLEERNFGRAGKRISVPRGTERGHSGARNAAAWHHDGSAVG